MKNTVKLPIFKEHYAQYLRSIFNASKNEPVCIKRTNDIGRILYASYKTAHIPIKHSYTDSEIVLDIALPNTFLSSNQRLSLYYSKEDICKINDFIIAEFNQEYRRVILYADDIGISHKNAIRLWLEHHKIDSKNYDMLVKKDYRSRKKIAELFVKNAHVSKY
jgi:hypothetical protein